MVRVRKPQPSLENTFFSTSEQKVVRFLLSEPTSVFSFRVISSRLKGVRGLGGTEGIMRILGDLETAGIVDFVDNRRAVRLHDDGPAIQLLKIFVALCDLEGLKSLLVDISDRAVLFGPRAEGTAATDSEYDLFVVSRTPDEVERVTSQHPLGRLIRLVCMTPEDHAGIDQQDPELAQKVSRGIVLWGSSW